MTQGRHVGAYVSAAHSMLGLALLIAAARIGDALGWWTVTRLGAIAAHFHLAAFGFAGLTAVGVGSRMLPMFLVAGRAPDWPVRWIGPVASLALLVLASGLFAGSAPAMWAGALLGVCAAALFVRLVAGFFRHRLRRRLEPAFGHVIAGFAALVASIAAGVALLATPGFSARGAIVYAVLVLLGWLVVFITGIWYRLFAFLVWLHLYGREEGATRVRTAADLVHHPTAWTALALLVLGIVTLAAGVGTGASGIARGGATGLLAGALVIAGQYLRMYQQRGTPPRP
jgi:hypothetical protein